MANGSSGYDFTQGSIPKKMVYFSVPIFLSNLLQASYQFIDSLWVGNLLGSTALAAIAISGPIIFTVLSFIIGINNATLTVLSQYKGANDQKGLEESLNAFVVVLGCLAIVFGILGYFISGDLLSILGAPKSIFNQAARYLQINFIGIIFLFGYNFINTILRALGNSKTPVRFVMLAVVLNAMLDPLFIRVVGLGIKGAAFATIISQGVAFLYGLWYSIKKANVPFKKPTLPKRKYFGMLFKLGVPSGFQMMSISAGTAAITSVVAHFGGHVLAGYGAASRITNLIMLPATTLGSTVNSMFGQNIGANKWGRVKTIALSGLVLIIVVSLSIGGLVFLFSSQLIHLFVNDQSTIHFGSIYLKIIAFFYIFLGINFILNNVVRAAGAMFQALALNIVSFWILRFPLTYLMSHWIGPEGIAVGMGISFVVSSIVATLYYWKGRWRDIRLIEKDSD